MMRRMEPTPPRPLNYATPVEPPRSKRVWILVMVVMLVVIALVAGLFARVQVTPIPSPVVAPPGAPGSGNSGVGP